jgi:hypothetical protein
MPNIKKWIDNKNPVIYWYNPESGQPFRSPA